MPVEELDLQAVAKADERFWARHPELNRRTLTSDPSDARYRSEWMKMYEQALQESPVPAPAAVPKPVPPPPPVNAISPVQACPVVALMTHDEKMEVAIQSTNLGEDVLRELGDIKTLVATMVIVGGGLAVAGVAAAATGVGLLVEGVAAVGAALLVAGAAMSGWQIGEGLTALHDFFQETRCDRAATPQQLNDAGKKFGTGIAKVGVGTVNLLLSLLGGRGKNWRGKSVRGGVEEPALREKGFKQEAEGLDKKSGGHVTTRHGPEVAAEALRDRLVKGKTPGDKSGKVVNAPPASTRFSSYEETAKTQRAALDKLAREKGVDLTKPPKDGITEYDVLMDHGRAIDDGFVGVGPKTKVTDPITGKDVKVWQNVKFVAGIQTTFTKVVWDRNEWKVVQHFPKP